MLSKMSSGNARRGVYVFQSSNGKQSEVSPSKGYRVFEEPHGSLAFNAFFPILSSDGRVTIQEAFDQMARKVSERARVKKVFQKPVLQTFQDADVHQSLRSYFKGVKEVLIISPEYQGAQRLRGAEQDVLDFIQGANDVLSLDCRINVLSKKLNPNEFLWPNVDCRKCTQALAQAELQRVMELPDDVAVFVFGHGVVREYDGYKDEYLYFPDEQKLTISGRFMGGLTKARQTHQAFVFVDLCNSVGWPDYSEATDDEEMTGQLVARDVYAVDGISRYEVQALVDKHVSEEAVRYAAYSLAGLDVGPAYPIVDRHVRGFVQSLLDQNMQSLSQGKLSIEDGGDIATPDDELLSRGPKQEQAQSPPPPAAIAATPEPVATAALPPPRAEESRAEEQDDAQPLVARDVETPVAAGFDLLRRLSGEGLAWAWNMAEMASQGALGSGLGYVLGPLLIVLVVALVVTGLSAFGLYSKFILKNHRATLGPAMLVMVITTALPYLCDPEIRGRYLSMESSFYLGALAFVISMGSLLLSVMANWRQVSSYHRVVMRGTGLVRNSCALGGLALEMYFMGHGLSIQQTMHIRAGGVDSFVVYYPMQLNGTVEVCAVPSRDGRLFLMPSETGYSMFDKQLEDGTQVDYTCLHDVFKMRVVNRSRGDTRNLQGWVFQQGKLSIPLAEMHAVNGQAQQIFQVNMSSWEHDPLMGRLELACRLEDHLKARGEDFIFDSPLSLPEPPATIQEKLAAPFCLAAEWALGIVLSPVAALFSPFA